jgi:phosphoribosyl 1,2-cyclic phosphate phosphodiesterase
MKNKAARIVILGSSSSSPFPRTVNNHFGDYSDIIGYTNKYELHNDPLCVSALKGGKDRRTRSSLAFCVGEERIIFDAGPDIKYQLERSAISKPTAIFITHDHWDACYGLEKFSEVAIYRETAGTVKPGNSIKIDSVTVTPFRVEHALNVPTVGYRVDYNNFSFGYFTDIGSLSGIQKEVGNCDFIFADGSSLYKSYSTHLSMVKQLEAYKEWGIKKVYFTHIGHSNPVHEELEPFLQSIYPSTEVTFDGMEVVF